MKFALITITPSMDDGVTTYEYPAAYDANPALNNPILYAQDMTSCLAIVDDSLIGETGYTEIVDAIIDDEPGENLLTAATGLLNGYFDLPDEEAARDAELARRVRLIKTILTGIGQPLEEE